MPKIMFLGDYFYDHATQQKDIANIIKWVKKQDAAVILNLEGPLTKSENKIEKRGPHLFQSQLSINILKELNVIGVSLANNHIMDYGKTALKRTIELLDENGIKHTGAGMNLKEASIPMAFQFGNVNYKFYSFGWSVEDVVVATDHSAGAAAYNKKRIYAQIEQDIREGNKVVLLMHWGFENNLLPQPIDIEFAHKAIEMGVELIIGHHPHVIQASEIYQEKGIYYSLGNFYFGSRRELFTKTFDTRTPNENDYGLGVIWETENNSLEEFIICYDRVNNESRICSNEIHSALDISVYNNSIYKYKRYLRKNKRNINPILVRESFCDNIKLFVFQNVIRKYIRNIFLVVKKYAKKP